jgi:hypothetical protein
MIFTGCDSHSIYYSCIVLFGAALAAIFTSKTVVLEICLAWRRDERISNPQEESTDVVLYSNLLDLRRKLLLEEGESKLQLWYILLCTVCLTHLTAGLISHYRLYLQGSEAALV